MKEKSIQSNDDDFTSNEENFYPKWGNRMKYRFRSLKEDVLILKYRDTLDYISSNNGYLPLKKSLYVLIYEYATRNGFWDYDSEFIVPSDFNWIRFSCDVEDYIHKSIRYGDDEFDTVIDKRRNILYYVKDILKRRENGEYDGIYK